MRPLNSIVCCILLATAPSVSSMPITNVARGASVTLNGTFFQGGYPGGSVVDPSTLVDGLMLPQSTYWQQGGVWWHEPVDSGQNIVLDLRGEFLISRLIVQADDNDSYELFYRKGRNAGWNLLWSIPNYDYYLQQNFLGMQTRPDPFDNSAQYSLEAPVVATELMLRGGTHSDFLYSVSEIQAFGRPIPEPHTLFLVGTSLFGHLLVASRRTRRV